MGCTSKLWAKLTLHCLSSFFKLLLLLNQDKCIIHLTTETMHRTIWLPENARSSKGWKPRLHHKTQLPHSIHTFMLSVPARQASPQMFLFKVSYLLEGATLTCWLKSMVEKHLYFTTAFCQVMRYTCKIIPPYHNRVTDAQTHLFVLWPHTLKIHFPKAVRLTLLKNFDPMIIAYMSPSVSLATCFK